MIPTPGDILPNGARTIAAATDALGFVVLALAHEGTPHAEYVTWVGRTDDWATFSGHYYGSLADAANDYAARGGH